MKNDGRRRDKGWRSCYVYGTRIQESNSIWIYEAVALPFEVDLIAEAYVTISQNQSVVIDKSLSELTCAGKTLTVKLSQEDTLKLQQSEFKPAEVQIRVRMKSGDALASDIMRLHVGRILKEGVI